MSKKIFFLICVVLFVCQTFAQTTYFDLDATVNRKYQGYSKGDKIKIKGLVKQIVESKNLSYDGTVNTETQYFLLLDNGNQIPISFSFDNALNYDIKTTDDLNNAAILKSVLVSLQKNGPQTRLRYELENEALSYVDYMQRNHLEFDDPYLLDYIYTLVNKIAPSTLIDGRPGSVNLMIEINPELNASTFPNGTILITTGLLSNLHSEDELVAVLAHEIGHFLLDHSVQNINEMIEKQKRAEALAAFATFMAGVVDVAGAVTSNGYYIPGAITATTAAVAFSVARNTANKMGMEYNHKQENEADRYAKKIVKILGYDTNSVATALNRIVNVMQRDRMNHFYFASYTHPSLMERINKAGIPSNTVNSDFERMVSFAVTNNAFMKYDNRRFKEALEYTSQNINNKVGTADDYLIKANCLLALYDKPETNNEALSLINKAKQLEPNNFNLHKAEILAQLRLKNKSAAINLLTNYVSYLDDARKELPKVMNETIWERLSNKIDQEEDWAEKMKIKLAVMNL